MCIRDRINITPAFKPEHILFMEQGGVVVNVNLRGGSEYGERWHKAGMLDRKPLSLIHILTLASALDFSYLCPHKRRSKRDVRP